MIFILQERLVKQLRDEAATERAAKEALTHSLLAQATQKQQQQQQQQQPDEVAAQVRGI